MKLPRPLRNLVAGLVIDAFHDGGARDALGALAAVATGAGLGDARPLPPASTGGLFVREGAAFRLKGEWRPYASTLADRAERARGILAGRPLEPATAPLATGLTQAALLFDARLYFEVHERLEPYWMRATGHERAALQGLIQVAVGLEHLADGNVRGARSLLDDGVAKLVDRELEGRVLRGFAQALRRCLDDLIRLGPDGPTRFQWTSVPDFPTGRCGMRREGGAARRV